MTELYSHFGETRSVLSTKNGAQWPFQWIVWIMTVLLVTSISSGIITESKHSKNPVVFLTWILMCPSPEISTACLQYMDKKLKRVFLYECFKHLLRFCELVIYLMPFQICTFQNLNVCSKLGYKIQLQKEANRRNDWRWGRKKGHEPNF